MPHVACRVCVACRASRWLLHNLRRASHVMWRAALRRVPRGVSRCAASRVACRRVASRVTSRVAPLASYSVARASCVSRLASSIARRVVAPRRVASRVASRIASLRHACGRTQVSAVVRACSHGECACTRFRACARVSFKRQIFEGCVEICI